MLRRFVALLVLLVYTVSVPRGLRTTLPVEDRVGVPAGGLFPLPAVDLRGDTVLVVPARDRTTVIAMFPEAMIERRAAFLALLDSLRRYPPESVAVVVLMAPGIAVPEAARQGEDTVLLYFFDRFGVIRRVGDREHPTLLVVDSTGTIRQVLVVPTS